MVRFPNPPKHAEERHRTTLGVVPVAELQEVGLGEWFAIYFPSGNKNSPSLPGVSRKTEPPR